VSCNQRGEADDLRRRKLRSLSGPIELSVPIRVCVEPECELLGQRIGAEVEYAVAPPHWTVTWDLFAWMGHRRFGRHWSVPQIRCELHDRFSLAVSDDWVEDAVLRYQVILAAREVDVALMREEYADVSDVILTIDGLQPEKGHETLYVVRELRLGRVWFAEPLLSSSAAEVRRLFERAKEIASSLGKPVRCWMSDKQRAFVTGVAEVFAGVPHRYCNNHFLRDLAKPILEKDSHAKVQMRRKVRGLREIEKSVLVDVRSEQQAVKSSLKSAQRPSVMANGEPPKAPSDRTSIQREVVLEYCEAVRGILSDDQGGPLNPPGVRMDVALGEVQQSIERLIDSKKGGRATRRPRRASAPRRVDAH
jgi:hypothetical protein